MVARRWAIAVWIAVVVGGVGEVEEGGKGEVRRGRYMSRESF